MKNTTAVLCLTATIASGQPLGSKTLVLEKDEGEKRVRLPREGVANRPVEFTLKITPEGAGSQDLILGTQTIPPGGTVPKHRHLDQDEVVVLQSRSARMTLAGKGYDVHAGGIVFAPANTWMALENTGTEDIQLIFIYSAPGNSQNCAIQPWLKQKWKLETRNPTLDQSIKGRGDHSDDDLLVSEQILNFTLWLKMEKIVEALGIFL